MTASEAETPPRPAGGSAADGVPVLHAVTSDEIVVRADFHQSALRVMHAGGPRVAVHLRAPRLGARRLYELAVMLADAQDESGAWLVINDRADVALASGARGVQLTSRSITPADARLAAPPLIIGASVHSMDDAAMATESGARWLVAGHASEHGAEANTHDHNIGFIERLAAVHAVPIIAIGGVRPEHVPTLRAAGAHGVAAIRGIWQRGDAGAAVIDYLSAHDAPGGR